MSEEQGDRWFDWGATVVMVLLCIVVSLFVLVLAYGMFGRAFNPVTLYTVPFVIGTCLSSSGLFGIYSPSDTAVGYVAVGIFGFFFGCTILSAPKKIAVTRSPKVKTAVRREGFPERRKLFLVIMTIAVLVSIPYLRKTMPLLVGGSGLKAIKFEYLNVEGSTLFSTDELLVFQWLVIPIFRLAYLVFCWRLAELEIDRSALVFSIVGMIIVVCVSGGRDSVFVFLVLVAVSLAMSQQMKSVWSRVAALPRSVKVVAIVGIVAISLVTQQRSLAQGAGIVENFFYYFAGAITYFSGILANPISFGLGGRLFYGASLLGFVSNPIEVAGAIISGGTVRGTENAISTSVAVYQNLSDHVSGNALSTSIYPFMRDFGVVGVFLGPMFYGAMSALVWLKWSRSLTEGDESCRMRWFMITAYLAYCLVFSVWRYVPLFTSTGMILFLVLMLTMRPVLRTGTGRVHVDAVRGDAGLGQ